MASFAAPATGGIGRNLDYIEKIALGFPTWSSTSGFANSNAALLGLANLFGQKNNQQNAKNTIGGSIADFGTIQDLMKEATNKLLLFSKGKGTNWQNLVNEIYGDITGYQNPYLAQLEPLVSQWLSPEYKAYSDEKLKDWYEQGKEQLEGDIFKQWDEGYGQSMAARNLTGSGVGDIAYSKILGQKGGALADLWSNIQQYGEEATRSDRALATSLVPTMTQLANLPMDQKMQLLNLMTSMEAAEKQRKGQSAAGWGQAIGAIGSALLGALKI